MKSHGFSRIESLYHAARLRPVEDRAAFLAEACGDDEDLQREVESLLAEHAATGGFLNNGISPAPALAVGMRVGVYQIVGPIGVGGMGEVYKARDVRLGRTVAIKVISGRFLEDPGWRDRLHREGRAISALNHPHICTLYDIGREGDVDFLVLEFIEGETLAARLTRGAMPVPEAVAIAVQIVDALAAAHRKGVIHRDIKPANIILTPRGDAKVLDFGLASSAAASQTAARSEVLTAPGGEGVIAGTPAYMSPEQRRGERVDQRSDLFALGIVLQEMITGGRSLNGASAAPDRLQRIIRRLVEHDPVKRYQRADEVVGELKSLAPGAGSADVSRRTLVTRIAVAVILIVGLAAAGWFWRRVRLERWAAGVAPSEIEHLAVAGDFAGAAALSRQALAVLPDDATLRSLWRQSTQVMSFTSVPAGATIEVRPYGQLSVPWRDIGRTPQEVRIPRGEYVGRVSKSGFAPVDVIVGSAHGAAPGEHLTWSINFTLRSAQSVPDDMVPVPPSRAVALQWPTQGAPVVALDGFLIDRHEVTNEEFKQFVDAGAYRDARFWPEPFSRNGRPVSFQEGIAALTDATGRAGPSTWEGGSYPKGMDKYPVAGVSWFEAAAYARFVGKTLPTAYHWTHASQSAMFAGLIAAGGNFSRRGTQPVGGAGTTSGYGTTDMAGNVKEWCVNATRDGARYALGGGFGDPFYEFSFTHTEDPWARRANIGFRCVKLDRPPEPAATGTIDAPVPDWSKRQPASDEALDAFKRGYAYDRTELNAQVEESVRARDWTHERVTFAAAYGSERVTAHVFTPVNFVPPFQAVVYVPGGYSMVDDKLPLADVEDSLGYLMRNGRALVMPIYKGTYERRDGVKPADQTLRPEFFRDHLIMAVKDLSRTLDYLETRKDMDASRLGFIGLSFGAKFAPIFLVVEPRLRAAVLDSGGFAPYEFPADVQPLNFITRVRVPTLMLNGRYDSDFPLESAQNPFFKLLGTPAADKRHVVFEAAHGDFPVQQQIRETLDWFDKYLGAVQRR